MVRSMRRTIVVLLAALLLSGCSRETQVWLPEEEVVDEMLSILSDRNAFIKKKETEEAQAKINEMYEFGLGEE